MEYYNNTAYCGAVINRTLCIFSVVKIAEFRVNELETIN